MSSIENAGVSNRGTGRGNANSIKHQYFMSIFKRNTQLKMKNVISGEYLHEFH